MSDKVKRFTKEQMEALEEKGWKFTPYSHDAWEWMLFNPDGFVVAKQHDRTWKQHVKEVCHE